MMRRLAAPLAAAAALLIFGSCAETLPPRRDEPALSSHEHPPSVVPEEQEQRYRETGTASWYGRDFQGRTTASGQTFDMNGLSAAHRTLPLGTIITVTNLDTAKTVVVPVNDRGPFSRKRFLELSLGAAKELGFEGQGTARVRIETGGPVNRDGTFTVQAASFVEAERARLLKERLQAKYELVYITTQRTNIATFYQVRVGAYRSEEKAERIAAKLTVDGLEPLVVRKD